MAERELPKLPLANPKSARGGFDIAGRSFSESGAFEWARIRQQRFRGVGFMIALSIIAAAWYHDRPVESGCCVCRNSLVHRPISSL
jgi:hypothetical protein